MVSGAHGWMGAVGLLQSGWNSSPFWEDPFMTLNLSVVVFLFDSIRCIYFQVLSAYFLLELEKYVSLAKPWRSIASLFLYARFRLLQLTLFYQIRN